ncbi:MAG: hypothetical protein L0H84_18115, partial [Pseudonocardia sp.]|nr:hypothetical protein [Pseudonocardia sp.]
MAFDRGDRFVVARTRVAQRADLPLLTSAGVVAQVWRGGPRQARLARLLAGVEVRGLGSDAARDLGVLLGRDGSADVVDAHLASLVRPGDDVMTSDP